MKTFNHILVLIVLISSIACSKQTPKTPATFKLNLSGMVDFSTGVGSGGALIVGRSDTGEVFGKIISSAEESMKISNGNWMFYSVIWNKYNSEPWAMKGTAQCAKSIAKLNGKEVSVKLDFSNINCTDSFFSGGRVVDTMGVKSFARIFIEECDSMYSNIFTKCGMDNQGSAVSYRFVFSEFTKDAKSGLTKKGQRLVSECALVNTVSTTGLPINFPIGASTDTPFIASLEMFLSSSTCDPQDPAGVYVHNFEKGLLNQNEPVVSHHKILASATSCEFTSPDFIPNSTDEEKADNKAKCISINGSWNGTTCNTTGTPAIYKIFSHPTLECVGTKTAVPESLKHMIAIPRVVLCGKYINKTIPGFAGGDGSSNRPYKICTEWQLNQIGEYNADSALASKHYKLLNDLDMNKTDFLGNYPAPECKSNPSAGLGSHHNLNPLDGIHLGNCFTGNAGPSFTGNFNGAYHTIKNARIAAESVDSLGFVRKLSGTVRNLNFENLEVRGMTSIGGVAGEFLTGDIDSIDIKNGNIEARKYSSAWGDMAGGIAGKTYTTSKITNAKFEAGKVRGSNYIGGIAGENSGTILMSKFRGEIDSLEQNGATVKKTGGIAAANLSPGTIDQSFSEGYIQANGGGGTGTVGYVGGIVGYNTGNIKHLYSTMFLSIQHHSDTIFAGGLAAYNSASLTDCYSDTHYKTHGSVVVNYNGITHSGGVVSRCITPASNYSASVGTSISQSDLSDALYTLPFNNISNWERQDGMNPKLAWENHSCKKNQSRDAILTQINNGRGTLLLPVLVCNLSQFLDIDIPEAEGKIIQLLDDINLTDMATNSIEEFKGELYGDGHTLYGASMNYIANPSTAYNKGIIAINAGTLKDINVVGNSLTNSIYDVSDNSAGILAGVNKGNIGNIRMAENEISGYLNVGLVAGNNRDGKAGYIHDVDLGVNSVTGYINVGSVVGTNPIGAVISRISSQAKVSGLTSPTDAQNIGGISGHNTGAIDQVEFSGTVDLLVPVTTASENNVGGIIGYNDGILSNAIVDNQASITVTALLNVGGIIGYHNRTDSSSLAATISMGRILFKDAAGAIASSSEFNPVYGVGGGGFVLDDGNYYLQDNIASKLNISGMSGVCSGSAPSYSMLVSPTGQIFMQFLTGAADKANAFLFPNSPGPDGIKTLRLINNIPSNDTFTFTGAFCIDGPVEFYRLHTPSDLTGQIAIGDLTNLSNFTAAKGFDIAYTDNVTPANSTRQLELLEYHRSRMEKVNPVLPPPVWEFESGDSHPRLLQVPGRN